MPSVDQLASEARLSTDYFSQLFLRTFGKSPKKYILEVRMNQAKSLLESSDLSAKEIARLLGYKDADFFCRQFKLKLGMTPTQYRRSH